MKSILFLLFLSIPAPARLTEDLAQLRARYGVETVITMDGAGNGSAIFHKSGLELTCTLAAGKTTSIAIDHLGKKITVNRAGLEEAGQTVEVRLPS